MESKLRALVEEIHTTRLHGNVRGQLNALLRGCPTTTDCSVRCTATVDGVLSEREDDGLSALVSAISDESAFDARSFDGRNKLRDQITLGTELALSMLPSQ